ncbi:MAG: type II toxin-antitoxin system Phd/YefM family antitoxin [Deltaproteobacteria bacterium]|nr:type II toxin-antitoxin system Phd/YefM family antitoxin [Deltaproteobacteria bacterium]
MKNEWQLQEAKNRLSELVDRALKRGPQTITRRGKQVVVVIAAGDYDQLVAPRTGLVEFLMASPLAGTELDLERIDDPGREVSL